MPTPSWSLPYNQFYKHVNSKKEARFEYPLSNFGCFSYFQTFLSLGVKQGLQKLPKFDINDLWLLLHCNILIPRKCPCKTLFKAQGPPPRPHPTSDGPMLGRICVAMQFVWLPRYGWWIASRWVELLLMMTKQTCSFPEEFIHEKERRKKIIQPKRNGVTPTGYENETNSSWLLYLCRERIRWLDR